VIYVGANLLDPICLLRFPNGEYSPVKESLEYEPIQNDNRSFRLQFPIKAFDGTDLCQLRFATIRIWFSAQGHREEISNHGFVALVPLGSGIGNSSVENVGKASGVFCQPSVPEPVVCALNFAGTQSIAAAISTSGMNISGLNIQLGR